MRSAAETLTDYLTQENFTHGGRKSILVDRVELGITNLTREIAEEIIVENPELRTVIKSKINQVITKALNDDSYLNSIITQAVAKALTQHALGEED